MRSPIVAMLWEIWRLTRLEAAWRLALGIVGGLAVLAVFSSQREVIKDFSAAIALILIVMPHFVGWLSMAKLTSGRPGFPLHLLYTRPVRTSVLVAVPMAYLAAMPAAIYLVSALLLRVTSGYPFPLLPVAAWIAALNLVLAATNWSTRNRLIQMLGVMVATSAWLSSGHSSPYSSGDPGQLRLAPESVADAVRLPAHGLCTDRRDWPGIVRCGGRQCGPPAPRRCAGGHAPDRGLPRIPGGSRQPVPVPVSHLVRDAGAGVVRHEVQWTAGADDRSGARDRESAGVRDQRSHRVRSPAPLRRWMLGDALRAGRADPRGQCLRYSLETGTCVRERVRGDPAVRNRSAGRPQSAREVGLRAARADRGRPECMGIPVIHRRCGQTTDVLCAVGCV